LPIVSTACLILSEASCTIIKQTNSAADVIWSLFAHRLFARLSFVRRGAVRVGPPGAGAPPKLACASATVVLRKFCENLIEPYRFALPAEPGIELLDTFRCG
jgi:hypothetical protein